MHKKLNNLIATKFVDSKNWNKAMAHVHKFVNENKNVVFEATDSHILIRATHQDEIDLTFDICESIDGYFQSAEKFPNTNRVLSGMIQDLKPVEQNTLESFITTIEVAYKLRKETFNFTFNDIEFLFTTKYAKSVASAIDIILRDKKDVIAITQLTATSSVKPVLFAIDTTWYRYEIALTPIRQN